MPSSTLRDQLHRDGFVVVRGILSSARLAVLRAATARATALGRSGAWPHVRTVGKQFPPWDAAEAPARGIWGVQGLNDPALARAAAGAAAAGGVLGGEGQGVPREEVEAAARDDHAAFLRAYFGDEVLGPAKELMAPCGDEDLVMELHNLLVRPDTDFELRWHRDDVPPEATAEEELAKLGVVPSSAGDDPSQPHQQLHAQWNLALCDDDDSLVVVPGSHRRARTDIERAADSYADPLPGQLVVRLAAGDAVFYNNNILHRGRYSAGRDRATLHGSVGHVVGGRRRATNVLQHGVGAYVDACDFAGIFAGHADEERLRRRAEGMRDRLVELGRMAGSGVGFSLKG